MKRFLALLLALVMCASMAACSETPAEPTTEATVATEPETFSVFAFNALIDGKPVAELTEKTTVTATAEPEEGFVVDYWKVNGVKQEDSASNTFAYEAEEMAALEPVFRAEKKVTAVNCKFQFLDAKGKANGDSFEEFVFEEAYTNPLTGAEVADGTITLGVTAIIPSGYVVDYWKINGVPYRYGSTVTYMVVENLDEATEFEVVVKEKPITYYHVTCTGCTVNGKTDLWVAAGTTVTATASSGYHYVFYINGTSMNNRGNGKLSWTFTVNGDTHVEAERIVN